MPKEGQETGGGHGKRATGHGMEVGRSGGDGEDKEKLKEDVEGNGNEKTRIGKLKRKRKEKWVG